MTKKIKILHLEDVESDADLVGRVLAKGNIEAEICVVERKEDFMKALIEFEPEVILSDHTLPSFNSLEALGIFLQRGMKIPFILVTGNISEEYAVSLIKAGANDYILKDQLDRLPEAITNALEKIESDVHRENQKAQNLKEKTNAVLVAHEHERGQMSNELLENISQILAASNLYIDCAISEADQRMNFMQKSKKYILMAIDEIKSLSLEIMPPLLGEIALIESLDNWIEFIQQQNKMIFISEWKKINDSLTSDKLKLTIYRILQEQINNTIKFSNAQNVFISLEQTEEALELIIKDDGVGFDTLKIRKGVGLRNILTRTEIHNGNMSLESQPGKGCMLKVTFPV